MQFRAALPIGAYYTNQSLCLACHASILRPSLVPQYKKSCSISRVEEGKQNPIAKLTKVSLCPNCCTPPAFKRGSKEQGRVHCSHRGSYFFNVSHRRSHVLKHRENGFLPRKHPSVLNLSSAPLQFCSTTSNEGWTERFQRNCIINELHTRFSCCCCC